MSYPYLPEKSHVCSVYLKKSRKEEHLSMPITDLLYFTLE